MGRYNETQLRREFVDPMFKALGWDMENTSGYAEAYQDVIHEDSIKLGGATKASDYWNSPGGFSSELSSRFSWRFSLRAAHISGLTRRRRACPHAQLLNSVGR